MPQNLPNAMYDSFAAARTHFHDNGLSMMPVGGAFPQVAQVVALHGGMDMDRIDYVAIRRGAPPLVPSPKILNQNRVFLKGARSGVFPVLDVAGVMTYGVSGYLLFGILSPEGLASDFMLGVMPFPGLSLQDQMIPASFFTYTLVNGIMTQTISGSAPPSPPPLINGIISRG